MSKFNLLTISFFLVFVSSLIKVSAEEAVDEFSKVEIKTIELGHGIYMLMGMGGNMGVSVGDDGVFLIDDQFSPLTPKIKKAIA